MGCGALRKLQSCAANVLANTLLNPGPSDLTTSFRIYKNKRLAQLVSVCEEERWSVFQLEILVRARQLGLSVAEVPTCFVSPNGTKRSPLGPGSAFAFIGATLRLFFLVDY